MKGFYNEHHGSAVLRQDFITIEQSCHWVVCGPRLLHAVGLHLLLGHLERAGRVILALAVRVRRAIVAFLAMVALKAAGLKCGRTSAAPCGAAPLSLRPRPADSSASRQSDGT